MRCQSGSNDSRLRATLTWVSWIGQRDSAGLELRHWPILSVIILAEADAVCAKCA